MIELAIQVILGFVGIFVRDNKRKEEINRRITTEIERYNKEVMTSADIRERERATRKRLKDRIKNGVK